MLLGIDFGTTFSKMATYYLGQPTVLMRLGEYGIPSELYYDKENGVLVGKAALDAGQGSAAANLVSGVKMALLSGNTFTLDGRTFTAKEIVKEIYKTIITTALKNAKKYSVDTEIEGVVISIPAKFGIQERYLISEAARDCLGDKKIPIKAIIKEPVAAALAYYNTELASGKHILVYDLGGGTCDVALVASDSSLSEHYRVVDSDMIRVGGRNWDEKLIDHIIKVIGAKSGVELRGNPGYEEKVRRTAIDVKHELSNPDTDQAIARVEINGRVYTAIITRQIFDEITISLLERTLDCIRSVYERNCASCSIDEIICVGGSSNMLQVEEGLKRRFPECTVRLFEPEHAVVKGAAIYANMPCKESLEDMASFSYGIRVCLDYGTTKERYLISNIIMQGTPLPARAIKYFNPVTDNMEGVLFRVYESGITEETYDFDTSEKRHIGTIRLELPPGSKRDLSIECEISLNSEGLLDVRACEPSGNSIAAQFIIHN